MGRHPNVSQLGADIMADKEVACLVAGIRLEWQAGGEATLVIQSDLGCSGV
jgi:hypothetical protein